MLIIGFGHKARQGKNSAAISMLNLFPLERHARLYAYADALRAEVKRAIRGAGGQDRLVMTWQESGLMPAWVSASEIGKPRTLLQWWGTDYRRKQDPDYWVKRLQETLEREQPEVALITDVRFPNEADAIHAAGGYLIKCTRTSKPDIDVPPHPSEQALDGYTAWDFHIEAANLTELRKQAAVIYKKIAR